MFVFAILMYHLQIVNVEEEHLLAVFGHEYPEYKKGLPLYREETLTFGLQGDYL